MKSITCTSGYVNGWDQPVSFTCGHLESIVGFSSYHDNGKEDRRWRFKCAKLHNGKFMQIDHLKRLDVMMVFWKEIDHLRSLRV